MKYFNQETLIPVSLVIAIIGGVPWLTSVYAEIKTSSDKIGQLSGEQSRRSQQVEEILQRLAVIQEKLERIDKHVSR